MLKRTVILLILTLTQAGCYIREESGVEEADPKTFCMLLRRDLKDGGVTKVRKETLIVEATLTTSCIPIFMEIPFIYKEQFRCRDSDIPKHDPSSPI